jgi:hypothetical protein
MEIRLARANSLIDIEDGSGDAGVVTGAPAAVTERVSCALVGIIIQLSCTR